MKEIILGLVLLLLLPLLVSATDYYVDKDSIGGTCSDSNPGTQSQPWCTIGKANQELRPGDTVYIREGTYSEGIRPSVSGTPGNYITYKAHPGESPTITRHQVLTGWQQHSGNIYVTDYAENWYSGVWEDTFEQSDYYVALEPVFSLSDLNGPGKYFGDENSKRVYVWTRNGDNPNNHVMRMGASKAISMGSKSYITIDGISIKWVQRAIDCTDCSNCIFQNLNIEYSFGTCIGLSGSSNYNKILNNRIFNVGSWYWDEGDGIHLSAGAHHNLIEGNDVSIIAHNPITSYGASGPAPHHNIIQNNVIHDSGSSGLNTNIWPYREVWRNNIAYGNTGAGLQTDSSDNIYYWNKFYNNGWLEDAESEGISVYAVTSRGVLLTDNNKFFHNVIYDSMGRGVAISNWGGTCNNNVFKNNIFFDNEGVPDDVQIRFDTAGELDNNIFTHNLIYKDTGTDVRVHPIGTNPLSWWENNYASNFNNNIQDDPEFNNVASADFELQSGSPCIDTGDWLTTTRNAGSGTNIPVEDATYFIDGYGIVEGDLIQLEGETATARITNVNYNTNTLTVDKSLTWSNGQGVSFPYSGSKPDIGAYEYDSGYIPPPPPPPPNPADIDNDNDVDLDDLIHVVNDFSKKSGFTYQKADTDSNGVIDIFDIVFVARRFT